MNPLDDANAAVLRGIKGYVLNPDENGSHLRQLAEYMADMYWRNGSREMARRPDAKSIYIERAAEEIAGFIHMVWDGAGPDVYAPRTFEIMRAREDSVRGIDAGSAWEYALTWFSRDMKSRLRAAEELVIDPAEEDLLLHDLLDHGEEHRYLHDLVRKVEYVHWKRKH
jgi:hypothetical protein